jgi:hypothetical protein
MDDSNICMRKKNNLPDTFSSLAAMDTMSFLITTSLPPSILIADSLVGKEECQQCDKEYRRIIPSGFELLLQANSFLLGEMLQVIIDSLGIALQNWADDFLVGGHLHHLLQSWLVVAFICNQALVTSVGVRGQIEA